MRILVNRIEQIEAMRRKEGQDRVVTLLQMLLRKHERRQPRRIFRRHCIAPQRFPCRPAPVLVQVIEDLPLALLQRRAKRGIEALQLTL